uniref:Coiled-coil domain containing 142 n=1 Tax=Seriola dumerili TaxID=41447 RepID=A0A3B4T4F2_SERDU
MDQNNPETLKDPGGEPGLTADWNNSESVCPEKEQRRCLVTEDVTTNGSWSQSSISRSLQRAETLLRTTFNPSLKWLFHSRSQDEDAEEGHFVVAHNLVSRSSARLLRLQQALLTVAPQWQLVGGAQVGSPQVCVKGIPEREAEGGVVLVPSSSSLQGPYRTLWRLLEQRSLLLFIHEYTRRARLAAAYISRVSHLLEEQLRRPHLTPHQTLSSLSSFRVSLGSLSQELRVHLNHWSCLFSKVQSDHYLRPALVQQTRLLVEIKQTLDSLGLQALVLMEHYVCVILSAVAQAELDSVPREVLQDILAGTDVYNQAVEEQRAQRSATQLRTAVLLRAHHSTLDPGLPHSKQHHPAAFSVRELTVILAVHHAETAAEQLRSWASAQSCQVCQVHHTQEAGTSSVRSSISCGTCTLRPEWTWEQLQHTFLIPPPLLSSHQPTLQLHQDSAENHLPVLAKPTSVQQRPDCSDKDPTSQCQTHIPRNSPIQASVETVDLAQPHVENCEPPQTISPPSESSHRLSAPPVSAVCQQERSSVELLFQLLVSCSDLLVPLVSHTEAPAEPLLPHTPTDVTVTAPIISTDDSVELNRLSTDLNTEGSQADWAELDMTTRLETTCSSGFQRDRDPEGEGTVGLEGTAVAPDCVRPHSVQWLDLGQSLVFADLLGQYRALLWTLCSRALWLQMFVPPAGNAAGSINLQDNHRGFQILDRLSRASKTEDLVPKECRAMLEDFRLNLLVCTAHAQWDYVLCRGLGSALKDKCLIDGSHSVMSSSKMMSVTMEHFLLLTPPLLSSLCCQLSDSRSSGSSSLLTLHRQSVSLVLATVQLSTFWILSKAYQFLSSWSLNRFLLITQGDLKELRESLEVMVRQTRSLMMTPDSDYYSSLLLRQQLEALDRAVSELQTFSSLVLKTFSSDCKRMSGEIFEQTMPSSVHWKHSHRTGFPSSPSEYASLAAQTVIGQVLEGVAPLSDDARVQALSVTMTAFLEAWMEHILKQKIKFSVQGALQLKQDFDSIRELIQSDRYGLSADLHQHLLSLRVFQQVDSAVVCLLQQPQAKPYLQSRTWEPFTRCCPAGSRDSSDAAVGSSITNLGYVEGEDLTQADPSVMTSDLPPVDPSNPGEPYLAPSLALGPVQQEWLDLRIHGSARRWRLPGLQCLSKSEP